MIMIKKYLKKLSLETDNMFKKLSKINHFFRFYHHIGVEIFPGGAKNSLEASFKGLFFAPPGKISFCNPLIFSVQKIF